MWSATIKQKGIVDKSFLVNVSYSNGIVAFNEVVDMTGGTLDGLNQKVQNRIDTLNTTETLIPQITNGPFAPSVATPANAAFLAAVKHFRSCQNAVTLGLMQNTDLVYTSAQLAMVSAYDPSFIDSL